MEKPITAQSVSGVEMPLVSTSTPSQQVKLVRLAGVPLKLQSELWTKLSTRTCHYEAENKLEAPIEMIRSLPTVILYDRKGLDLFDQITYQPAYYLTEAEIECMKLYGKEITSYCKNGSILVELGVGSMRKTRYLLEPLTRSNKKVTYYAIDLEETSLRSALEEMSREFPTISFCGLLGTYDEGLNYLAGQAGELGDAPRCVLWLGSSIGNMKRKEAAQFFVDVADKVLRVGDFILCGIDSRNDPAVVSLAYNDPLMLTDEFIMNGLDAANNLFNDPNLFDRSKFEYLSIYNSTLGRHEAYYRSLTDHVIKPISSDKFSSVEIKKGELINIEYSYKYSHDEVLALAQESRLSHITDWRDSTGRYGVHLFQKPPFSLQKTETSNTSRCPGLLEYHELWKIWFGCAFN